MCNPFINHIKMIIRTFRQTIFRILQDTAKLFNINLSRKMIMIGVKGIVVEVFESKF